MTHEWLSLITQEFTRSSGTQTSPIIHIRLVGQVILNTSRRFDMEEKRVSIHITLPASIDDKLESIMMQLGLRSKSCLIERLLREVFDEVDDEPDQLE